MIATARWQQRFSSFRKALSTLTEAVEQKHYNKLEQTGLVQLFNVTFELGWKTLRDLLISEGLSPKTPRETIKQAFQVDYIQNGELWLDALEKRNLMAHVYDEEISCEVLSLIIQNYYPLLVDLLVKLQEKNSK